MRSFQRLQIKRLMFLVPWLAVGCGLSVQAADSSQAFVRVSPRDARYFELSDGQPYIPIGLNLIAPDVSDRGGPASGLKRMEEWMQRLSANGGNYIRVWLSSPFWDVEDEHAGVYDSVKAQRIDALVALARQHGIRMKLTLEHFRSIDGPPRQRWAHKPLHHVSQGGTATNLADFFAGTASRDQFKGKLAGLAKRYGDEPAIYGWELWNEINAVATREQYFMPWTETMLAELHRLFPRNLAMQSLGSFDNAGVRDLYRRHSLLPGNDVAQVHRYLDLGARLEVCHGPVDVLTADAVRELLAFDPKRPIILAESGAVEPRHSGPFKLYAKDKHGLLLHDILFAPFFAGAAGPGQCWHWDSYVDRNNLWFQFGRFAAAVKDIDPPAEHFQPLIISHPRLRVYALKGTQWVLLWCRDTENTWQTELEQGKPPELLENLKLDLATVLPPGGATSVRIYDPWNDHWQEVKPDGTMLTLPAFSRSVVVRVKVAK